MTANEITWYEEYLEKNKKDFDKRVFGSYLRYLDSYLHDKEHAIDGMKWEDRMKHEPMPANIFLHG